MGISSRQNHVRGKKFSSGEIVWATQVLAEMHHQKRMFKFWRKDGSLVSNQQLVPKACIVCGAFHAGIKKEALSEIYNLSRMDWQKIVACFAEQPIEVQASSCINASRTIAKNAKRPRRQTV